MLNVFPALLALVVLATDAWSSDEQLPQTGVIASTRSGGYGSRGESLPVGGVALDSDKLPAISGSVAPQGNRVSVTVSNNSEDDYSLNLQLSQFDSSGRQLKSDPFSVSLKGGTSDSRSFSVSGSSPQYELSLRSYRRTSKAKVTPTAATTDAAR